MMAGTARYIADRVQLNVELVSTETGALLWSDRFEDKSEAAFADPRVMARWIRPGLVPVILGAEAARSVRERPNNPDERDLLIEGKATYQRSGNPQRLPAARALFERALSMNPRSANAMSSLAAILLEEMWFFNEPAPGGLLRVEQLVAQAEAINPTGPEVMWDRAVVLFSRARWEEALAAFERMLEAYPIANGPENLIAHCHEMLGRVDVAVGWIERGIRKWPSGPFIWKAYDALATAMLLLGRSDEAIAAARRGIAMNPQNAGPKLAGLHLTIASAYAISGRVSAAQVEASEATRIWPYATVRGWWTEPIPSPVLAAQIERAEEGLRRAGLRDHADEDADAGVPAQTTLREELVGYTPSSAPGATTIRTQDLAKLLGESKPIVIDTAAKGRSIPAAVGLRGAGTGGDFTDDLQTMVRRKMAALTAGNRDAPIVTLDWNAERWGGYNLALRLAALGYKNVLWYRGGQEAWQAAGQRTADMTADDW
jgi:tetratricopeptide (TPR) repeat protein